MSELIEEFKSEHSGILAILSEAKKLGILSHEGQSKLMSAKVSLLAHLKKEDEQFYPVLRKEAENNKQLKTILVIFAIDMENISSIVVEFFDKYSRGVSGKELQREYENLLVALGKMIRNEEDILYEEYDMANL